jgi:putative addiction module component (TIGR02574 family)
MTTQTEQILSEALHLSPLERAGLVERILESFDFPNREEIDTAWVKEAEDRLDAYEKGKIGVKPAKEVFAKVYRNPAELSE